MKDLHWFKEEFSTLMSNYKIEYKSFKKGDFGDLERVDFEREDRGGYVDFWSLGWLHIHFIDCDNLTDLMNVLLPPDQELEEDKTFNELKRILQE